MNKRRIEEDQISNKKPKFDNERHSGNDTSFEPMIREMPNREQLDKIPVFNSWQDGYKLDSALIKILIINKKQCEEIEKYTKNCLPAGSNELYYSNILTTRYKTKEIESKEHSRDYDKYCRKYDEAIEKRNENEMDEVERSILNLAKKTHYDLIRIANLRKDVCFLNVQHLKGIFEVVRNNEFDDFTMYDLAHFYSHLKHQSRVEDFNDIIYLLQRIIEDIEYRRSNRDYRDIIISVRKLATVYNFIDNMKVNKRRP